MSRLVAIQAVLLDWDGTLLDSFQADTRSYLEMFRALGIAWGVRELAAHYSPDWYNVYRAAGLPRDRWNKADRLWRCAYRRHRPRLMPGARQVLRELRCRYRLGLVTSGDCGRVLPQLRQFHLTRTFSARVCHEHASHRKPHPEPLRLALRQLGVPPANSVYVGDAPEDIEMAKRAGVRSVGVIGPFPTAKRLHASRPLALLESIRQLPRLLAEWSVVG
ncbi:MAG TPA: HAD family hydrolase [Candidatus Acidoferrales bacterium]|nr:HAD family hydrolase [Candidatus Acidoferrales bacterium]